MSPPPINATAPAESSVPHIVNASSTNLSTSASSSIFRGRTNIRPPMATRPATSLPQLTPLTVPPLIRPSSKFKWPRKVITNQIYRVLFYLSLLVICYLFFSPDNAPVDTDPHLDFNNRDGSLQSRRQPSLPFKLFHPSFFAPSSESSNTIQTVTSTVRGEQGQDNADGSDPINVTNSFPTNDEESEIIRAAYLKVITDFMRTANVLDFNESRLLTQYKNNRNNVQPTCVLVQIRDGAAHYIERFKDMRHGRLSSVKYIIDRVIAHRRLNKQPPLPDVTFPVMVTDGHGVKIATFGSARHWRNWIKFVPVPMGNSRGMQQGWGTELRGWDHYIKKHIIDTYPNYTWESKIPKAMFRGALSMQRHRVGSCNYENHHHCELALNWTHTTRGTLYERTKNSELFDVGFTSMKPMPLGMKDVFKDAPPLAENIPFIDGQKYKYIINVGNNQDWAERMRLLLYTNSAVVMHEAETQEFFTPLLKPWEHYIPTNVMMTDIVENVKWAKENDFKVRQIVKNANAFAHRYVSEKAMFIYWELVMQEYSKRQHKSKPFRR